MIQRIQSVYLFMTTVLSLLFLKGGILNFINISGETVKLTFAGIAKVSAGIEFIDKSLILSLIIILIAVLSFATIFLFKKRKIQLWLTGALIGLVSLFILFCVYYTYSIITKYSSHLIPGIKMVLPVILLILTVLAFRGIRKDEELVRSYDRLR
jgi:hypothetical protein